MARISLSLGAILAMSVKCGVPVGEEPLYRFDTCEDLEAYLHEQVLHPRQETRGPSGGVGVFGCAMAASEDLSRTEPPSGSNAGVDAAEGEAVQSDGVGNSPLPGFAGEGEGEPAGGVDPLRPDDDPDREFSETNTQEEEVDEADFVKNDGSFLYILRRGEMIIMDAWPAEDARVVSRTTLRGAGFTMFFDGDRALVASRASDAVRSETSGSLVFELYDLFDRANPRLLREVQVDGQWVDARRVGDEMLLITRSQMTWPWWELNRSEPFTDDENRALLEQHGFERALPGLRDRHVGSDAVLREGLAFQCQNTWAPDHSDGTNLVVVHTLSLQNERQPVKSTAVLANPDNIYASAKSIYLADTVWSDGGHFTPHLAETRFHKLRAFEGEGAADYVATGTVRGVLHNQFAMDEEDDRLRVVISTNDDVGRDPEALKSSLLILEQDGVSLREVGRADDIGHGEFVQAVRFLGDRAYVVTFPIEGVDLSQPPVGWTVPSFPRVGPPLNDPLFVIDLADPTAPVVRGELEVSGYSTYIHPLDRDHILTIGVETDGGAVPTAMQLQIFDVTDLDAPELAHKETFGDGMALSEALTDHHAFTYFPATKALSVPVQTVSDTGELTSNGLALYRVDTEEGFAELGTVEQLGLYPSGVSLGEAGCAAVRRSIQIATSEEAYVYAISTGGVTIASIEEGAPEVATVPLLDENEGVCQAFGTPL